MRYISSFLLFVVVVFSSCVFDGKGLVIPESDLVNILTDLHIAEVMVMERSVPRDSLEFYKKLYFEKIAYIHGYDSEVIKSDIEKLQKMPQKIRPIYEQVEKRMKELSERSVIKKENVEGAK